MTAGARPAAPPVTPHEMGRRVLGPVVAEFCLRLWSTAAMFDRPDDTALLFCARGGLRLQLAYERFLAAARLAAPVTAAPLMVSRLAALRPVLARTAAEGRPDLLPAAAAAMSYEFSNVSLGAAVRAVSGVDPAPLGAAAREPFAVDRFAALLGSPAGRGVVDVLSEQGALFGEHLEDTLDGRRHAVLVDTGRYGTTGHLLAAAAPSLGTSSVLLARSHRPGTGPATAVGLGLEGSHYSPLRRRTVLLRYWHFVEWLFEPDLPSVRTFTRTPRGVRSNLEVPGWEARVAPAPDSPFAGVLAYLDALPPGPAGRVLDDADRAWRELHRAVVWPAREHGEALDVGTRSHDFGLDGTWGARRWQGPLAALRGSTMWREGEIARSGTPLRGPLLAAVEAGYSARWVRRAAARRYRRPAATPAAHPAPPEEN